MMAFAGGAPRRVVVVIHPRRLKKKGIYRIRLTVCVLTLPFFFCVMGSQLKLPPAGISQFYFLIQQSLNIT
ncbi:hypothetical protein BDQ94DRAFT_134675 [Aspergillus welwitschiae]|uniref:Uncharacterized protein n=1 Tax=Aspergillus welwitschiae TaxID=1341132 RepID=A0A3F3QHP8_9EURO|nr:hypothetical protein BDQ94DRAFT_134675 [Aspergillus welwitschiae]RDH38808.1 hypothetical protein BDQ94DRAFT_134675 [Aspergillus welwitschiae]